jgi:hypothetical protein
LNPSQKRPQQNQSLARQNTLKNAFYCSSWVMVSLSNHGQHSVFQHPAKDPG